MRSPADAHRLRSLLEGSARALALLALVLILIEVLRPADAPARRAGEGDLDRVLRAATFDDENRPLLLHLGRVPAPVQRDWAVALRRAGTAVQWSGEDIQPIAASLEPVADPRGGYELRVWRAGKEPAVVRDGAGELTRIEHGAGLTVVAARSLAGVTRVDVPRQQAIVLPGDSLRLGGVLVLGRAGWEARFLLRTLEDLGWTSSARLGVAPGIAVDQGSVGALDTGRYAAVIVLDSTAAPLSAAIARYVRAGGGLMLVGEGAMTRGLSALSPGSSAPRVMPAREELPQEAPFEGLPLRPVVRAQPDAIVLESRRSAAAIAAWRVGAGRVMQVGYEDSWRLRMEDRTSNGAVHGEWWGRLIASVAYAPAAPGIADFRADPAPLASLIGTLGAPTDATAAATGRAALPLLPLFILALVLFLLEWFSRRLRGAT